MSDEKGTEPEISFADMGLDERIQAAVDSLGYEAPTAIQALAIPLLMEGNDLIGQAQTGTGKTAAFTLPLLGKIDVTNAVPQLLVLAPTRELALQVSDAMKAYGRQMTGLKILPVYGGQGMDTQLRALRRGVHVVVGTPGRLLDHLERGTLRLDGIRCLVLDEADEMLRMGFIEEVEKIMERMPETRQTALFSATMPTRIVKIAKRFLRDPSEVRTKNREATVESISQYFVLVSGNRNKLEAMTRLLEAEEFDGMIVFVRTRITTVELAQRLEARGYAAQFLNGDMTQQMRQQTVNRFKKGDFDILVCTDVAARGLDVPRVSHVLNFDIPHDTESYVHRIGRTGRAGREGKAILFAGRRERRMLFAIEKATNKKIERIPVPTGQQIGKRRVSDFKELLTRTIEAHDQDFCRAIVESYCEESGESLETVSAALTFLFQRARPFTVEEIQIEDVERGRGIEQSRGRGADQARGRKSSTPKAKAKPNDRSMAVYRVEVGSAHGVQPKHLVGAIANESGLDSRYIGSIRIAAQHSVIELPSGMPPELLAHLRQVRVCGVRLGMSGLAAGGRPGGHRKRDGDDRGSEGGKRSSEGGKRSSEGGTRGSEGGKRSSEGGTRGSEGGKGALKRKPKREASKPAATEPKRDTVLDELMGALESGGGPGGERKRVARKPKAKAKKPKAKAAKPKATKAKGAKTKAAKSKGKPKGGA